VRVNALDEEQRREELAQLAGGQSAQETIAFADSLLAQAASLRQYSASQVQPPSLLLTTKVKKNRTKLPPKASRSG
jgi:hypothetical protein